MVTRLRCCLNDNRGDGYEQSSKDRRDREDGGSVLPHLLRRPSALGSQRASETKRLRPAGSARYKWTTPLLHRSAPRRRRSWQQAFRPALVSKHNLPTICPTSYIMRHLTPTAFPRCWRDHAPSYVEKPPRDGTQFCQNLGKMNLGKIN